jgi:hypothetical protein
MRDWPGAGSSILSKSVISTKNLPAHRPGERDLRHMTLLLFDPVRRNPERRQDVTQSGCESRSQRPMVASVEQDGQQGARTDREDERLSVLSFAKTRSRDWDHWARRRTSIVPRPAAARRSGPLISSFALEIWSAGGQQRAKGATVQRRDRSSRPKSRAVTTNSLNPRPSGFANLVQGSKTQRLHKLSACRAYGFGCGGRI